MRRNSLNRQSAAFVLVLVAPAPSFGAVISVIGEAVIAVRSDSHRGAPENAASSCAAGHIDDHSALPPELSLSQERPVPLEGLASLKRVSHRTRPGDSISKLMIRFGLSEEERRPWIRAVQGHYAAHNLPVGRDMHFYFTGADFASVAKKDRPGLKTLEIEIDEDWALTWEKGYQGIVCSKRERPYDVERRSAGGIVETALVGAGPQAGLEPGVLSELVDIFSWDVDFERGIQNGDAFRVVYEERRRRGSTRKPVLQVLAAELISAGQQHIAIHFKKEKGKGAYYDLDGKSLTRAFLRSPLEFTSISSYFSHSRFHPVLKVDRPHYGVDFVARAGTPIRAIGDGKVVYAGWKRAGYGRVIEIQHDLAYASRYAHLQGFARGIRRGIGVRKGQIIGYVGSSGLVTGAHLHFELYKDQRYVNPLSFEFPREDKIEPALHRAFEDLKRVLLAQLAAQPHS